MSGLKPVEGGFDVMCRCCGNGAKLRYDVVVEEHLDLSGDPCPAADDPAAREREEIVQFLCRKRLTFAHHASTAPAEEARFARFAVGLLETLTERILRGDL